MVDNALRSLLPAGTITWELQSGQLQSTPDLVLAGGGLADPLETCRVYKVDHGSDHRAVQVHFRLRPNQEPVRKRRRVCDKADWTTLGQTLRKQLAGLPYDNSDSDIRTQTELSAAAQGFMDVVNAALESSVPRARPSPCVKRWWTEELSRLRKVMPQLRNRVTMARRRGQDYTYMNDRMVDARRTYFDAKDRTKKGHWQEFLNNPEYIGKPIATRRRSQMLYKYPTL